VRPKNLILSSCIIFSPDPQIKRIIQLIYRCLFRVSLVLRLSAPASLFCPADVATLTDGCSTRHLDWLIPEKYMGYTDAGLRKGVIRPPSKLLLTACTLLQPRSENDNLRVITHAAVVVPLKQEGALQICPTDFFTLFHDPGKNMTANENDEHHSIRVKVCKAPPRSSSRRSSPVNAPGGSGPRSGALSVSPRSSQESLGSQRGESRLYFVSAETELEKSKFVPPQGNAAAFIDFYDHYSPLKSVFKEGDLIAIRYRTAVGNGSVKSLLYDPDSVAIFLSQRVKDEEVVPMDISHGEGEIQSSQWKVPKSETVRQTYIFDPLPHPCVRSNHGFFRDVETIHIFQNKLDCGIWRGCKRVILDSLDAFFPCRATCQSLI
jgi:hypothetical protein